MSDWFEAERRAERAQQLSEARRWAEALSELEAALEIIPGNAMWLGHRGFLLDQLDEFELAVEAYALALERDPDDRDLLLALAIDQLRVGRVDESLASFHRVTELHPDFEPGYCYQISAYAELGDHEKAEETFYVARQLRAECPFCYYHMALSLNDRGDHRRAIHCLERVLRIDPQFEGVRGLIAQAYRGLNDVEKARENYLIAIREDPGDVDLMSEFGDLLLESGDADGAAAKFRHVLELSTDHIDARFGLGRAALALDKLDTASEAFEHVRTVEPDYEGLDLHLGTVCLRQGRWDKARDHLAIAAADDPDDVQAQLLLGNCQLQLRRPAEAAEAFRRAITLDPMLANAHHNLGVCCFLLDKHDEGIEHCRKAIELKPDYLMAIVKTTLAYQRIGRFREARTMITYGLKVDPENAMFAQLRKRLWRVRLRYAFRRMLGWFVRSNRGSSAAAPTVDG
ncbi:MAG: tetratricopeptide repeat protein [Phycisphaerales bacterium]|nr:tetratricopeptide repeat protein [Phycisphaerales bacterium]